MSTEHQIPVEEGFDLLDEAALRDPASAFRRVLEEAPVFFHPPLDGWIMSRHDDVAAALPDFETFRCDGVGLVPVPTAFQDRFRPDFFKNSLIGMDPPRHDAPRKAVQRGFVRSRMKALEPRILESADELIDGFVDEGRCELMSRYCLVLTTRTLLALLDLPPGDEPLLNALRSDHIQIFSSHVVPMEEPMQSEVWARYAAAVDYLMSIVVERRRSPGEDIISTLAAATEADGSPTFSDVDVALQVCGLAFAGTDTTANLIGNAVVLLCDHEDLLEELVREPSLWANVVEETLRRHSSATAIPRHAAREVELSGTRVPQGARVWLGIAGANNDPRHYDHPERFDIHRPIPTDHVAFGKGRHFCPGAPLARLQGQIGLQRLFERIPSLRVDPDVPTEFLTLPVNSPRRRLEVVWRS